MTYTKSQSRENTYLVASGGRLIGSVRKVGKVFRGSSVTWEAYHAGKYLGSFGSRKEAGSFLDK